NADDQEIGVAMPQFEDCQKGLTGARDENAGAQDELFRAREVLALVDKQLRDLARNAGPNQPDGDAAGRKLAAEKRRLTEQVDQARASLDRSKTQLVGAFSRFDEWADPRRNLAAFNDDIPV